jgi:hypothetical protein
MEASPENRACPRFALDVPIRVYARDRAVICGHTVDISESGVSAMLIEEISLDAMVRLEFTVDCETIDLHALVRQRNAFRYGFQFVGSASVHKTLGIVLRQLSLEQRIKASTPL